MPSELANRVIGLISPVVGDFIAKAKVMAACKRMNTDIESLGDCRFNPINSAIQA